MDLRSLPSVAALLESPEGLEMSRQFSRTAVRRAVREVLETTRQEIRSSTRKSETLSSDRLLATVQKHLEVSSRPEIPRVINATGIILHTNLGRSLLSDTAQKAMLAAATHPVALEFDLKTGRRGHRDNHIRDCLQALTGAEDALAVNNNAAALMLAVDTLAHRREVIVSRGELIEIGGNFRLPDILRRSGAILREVGTTNRTRLSDISEAITRRTALILRAHPSNYRITGFTEMPDRNELVALARQT
ncbi:MAG: L-seryl-tRNA(Sec) selenium transferase, partial [Candidatus Binatia bacterium]|nr:L-seryl-tRNA(Sec) selenium transferase [Candidatus Binatia bacterium]